jgi:hypothetical protein
MSYYDGVGASVGATGTDGRSTAVRFHILMDKRHLKEGDRVFISGNLPVLTDWGNGLEMIQDGCDPNIWFLDVELPFGTIDFHAFGLFEYKFLIESATDGNPKIRLQISCS